MDILNTIIDGLFNFINYTVDGLSGDEAFRAGFVAAFGWLVVFGVFFAFLQFLAYCRAMISRFFHPVAVPGALPTRQGMSPFMMMVWAFVGVAGLIVIVGLFAGVIMGVVSS